MKEGGWKYASRRWGNYNGCEREGTRRLKWDGRFGVAFFAGRVDGPQEESRERAELEETHSVYARVLCVPS